MSFGNIGIGELIMILLVVMIVFGPKRLPEIARNMGKFMRDFRRETNAAIKELKEGIEPVKVGIFDEPDPGTAPVAVQNGPTKTDAAPDAPPAGAIAAPPASETTNGSRPAPDGKRGSATARKPAGRSAPRRKTAKTSASKPRSSPAKAKMPASRSRSTRKR